MDALETLLDGAGLFVNTSSLGMDGTEAPHLPFERMKSDGLVTDIVYVPLKTPFLLQAERVGVSTVDGLGMLLHQAAPGFEKVRIRPFLGMLERNSGRAPQAVQALKSAAEAYRDAQAIKGAGDAKAAAAFSDAFGRDPAFAQFYRSLDAYKSSFSSKSDVLVVDPSSDFFKGMRSSNVAPAR